MRRVSVVVLVLCVLLLVPSAAHSQSNPYGQTPPRDVGAVDAGTQVQTQAVQGSAVQVVVPKQLTQRASEDGLAVTGGDLVGLVALGGGLVVLGSGLRLVRRRQS